MRQQIVQNDMHMEWRQVTCLCHVLAIVAELLHEMEELLAQVSMYVGWTVLFASNAPAPASMTENLALGVSLASLIYLGVSSPPCAGTQLPALPLMCS